MPSNKPKRHLKDYRYKSIPDKVRVLCGIVFPRENYTEHVKSKIICKRCKEKLQKDTNRHK